MLPSGFSRQQRLLTASDFKFVFNQAWRSSDKYFTVLARNNGRNNSRLGLAIAKKQVRRAIDRNRIKRCIRESFRHAQAKLSGTDLVIMARRDTAATDNRQLRKSLEKHWQRVITNYIPTKKS